jgi:hypothetical protein
MRLVLAGSRLLTALQTFLQEDCSSGGISSLERHLAKEALRRSDPSGTVDFLCKSECLLEVTLGVRELSSTKCSQPKNEGAPSGWKWFSEWFKRCRFSKVLGLD